MIRTGYLELERPRDGVLQTSSKGLKIPRWLPLECALISQAQIITFTCAPVPRALCLEGLPATFAKERSLWVPRTLGLVGAGHDTRRLQDGGHDQVRYTQQKPND